MAAIQYINSFYMGQNLQNEGQFVWQCMTHLKAATEDLVSATGHGTEEAPLLCIQRALLLMKSHIETFRRRYNIIYNTYSNLIIVYCLLFSDMHIICVVGH